MYDAVLICFDHAEKELSFPYKLTLFHVSERLFAAVLLLLFVLTIRCFYVFKKNIESTQNVYFFTLSDLSTSLNLKYKNTVISM